jgi:hypothetical protein
MRFRWSSKLCSTIKFARSGKGGDEGSTDTLQVVGLPVGDYGIRGFCERKSLSDLCDSLGTGREHHGPHTPTPCPHPATGDRSTGNRSEYEAPGGIATQRRR